MDGFKLVVCLKMVDSGKSEWFSDCQLCNEGPSVLLDQC